MMEPKLDAGEKLRQHLEKNYQYANHISFGTLGVLRLAIKRFITLRGSDGAATTAFFTIFSFFPLLLVLIVLGSFFLESEQVKNQILQLLNLTFPISPDLIRDNIETLIQERSTIGITGLIGLAWSATGALSTLTGNINRAWPGAEKRSLLEKRIVAFIMIAALSGLLAVSSITTAVLGLLARFSEPLFGKGIFSEIPLANVMTNLIPLLAGLIIFSGIYRWVPNTEVKWKSAILAALLGTLAWQITTRAFIYYLGTGLAQYRLVYGTLGTIVALLFWIYLNYIIIIFGAHLSAAIQYKGKIEE